MKKNAIVLLALLLLAGCGSSGSGDPGKPSGSAKPGAAGSAKKGDAAPGSAALSNPEDNYVAAATKIGCLGLEAADADKLAKDRAAVLSEHGYTDDSWRAASKQLGASKGEGIVKAMETKCPD